MKYTALIVAAVLALVGTATAQGIHPGPGAGIPQPILIRISGFIGNAPGGTTTLGPLTLGVHDQVVTVELTEVQMLNGPLTEGRSALRQSDQYNPNLLVVGDPALLRQLSTAPVQSKLTLFGYLRGGDRQLLLVQVDQA